ncbi:MAG TPA: hypothetical protein VFY29_08635 [Terriglobia bacterium]|nr:hypothetical protein [Terriglobia bacterium]
MSPAARNLAVGALAAISLWGCSARPDTPPDAQPEKRAYVVSGRVPRDPRAKGGEDPVVTMTETVVDHQPAGPDGAGLYESPLSADGAFRFDEIPPGRYIARLIPAPPGANPVTIVVGHEDVTGVEIPIPLTVTVSGKVDVEGNGLTPRFTLAFGGASIATNGTARFTVDIREGEHRVRVAGLPQGYSVQALTYGPIDLLTDPLRIAADQPPQDLVVKLGVSNPPPWVRVRGRLTRTGQPATISGRNQLALVGINVKDRYEAAIRQDGSFEFPRVLPGKYNARLVPEIAGMNPVGLTVEHEDVDDWKIALPRPEIRVRVAVAGGGPPPNFQLIFYDVPLSSADPAITANRAIPMQSDGVFTTNLPPGEYARIEPHGLPRGYTVKSFTDGATDLLKRPLKVDGRNSKQLVLTIAKAP